MRERSSTRLPAGPVAVLATLLLACAGSSAPEPTKAKEQEFGDASRAMFERQIANPERSETRNPVEGLGATTASDVVSNYHENQKTGAQQRRQDRQRDSGVIQN